MSTSVIEILKGLVTPSLLNTVAPVIGLNGDVAGRGLSDMIGQYLGALVQQSGDRDAMANIADMANAVARDSSGITDIKGLLAGGIPSTMAMLSGNRLMGSLFGVWQASVVHKVAAAMGIKPEASSSLFNLAAPLVLSAISKRLGGGALTGAALAGLIGQERGALLGGLGSAVAGLASSAKAAAPAIAAAAPVAAASVARTAAPAAAPAPAAYAGRDNGLFTSFLWLLLPLAFIAWLGWQKMNEPPAEPPAATAAAEPAPAPAAAPEPAAAAAPAAAPAAPSLARIALAGGKEIEGAAEGVEVKIVNFINDPNATIDKTTWFNFDRLTFETGAATLTSESKAQIDNIVAILTAYPAVKMKIGGYTDNTGDPQNNLDLSGKRATKVMESIVAAGIAADRVEAEGYGDQFPVADNGTEEGRAQNRRTAVSIRAK